MGLNITTNNTGFFQFENREDLENAARNILKKHNSSEEANQKLIDKALLSFNKKSDSFYYATKSSIEKSFIQNNFSSNLKETLNYLKSNSSKPVEKDFLGEFGRIYESFEKTKDSYKGELIEFEIDANTNNIFIAA